MVLKRILGSNKGGAGSSGGGGAGGNNHSSGNLSGTASNGNLTNLEGSKVPYLVEATISHLEKHELKLEGIFRVSGSQEEVKDLKRQLDKRLPLDLSTFHPHAVSGALKLYFRELGKPLLCYELYELWTATGGVACEWTLAEREGKKRDLLVYMLRECWQLLPADHQQLLMRFLRFLLAVSQHSSENKMTPANLAIVFAPTLLRAEKETIEVMLGDAEATATTVELLIILAEELSATDDAQLQSSPPAGLPQPWTDAFTRAQAAPRPQAVALPGLVRAVTHTPAHKSSTALSTTLTPAPGAAVLSVSSPAANRVVNKTRSRAEVSASLLQAMWRGRFVRRRLRELWPHRRFQAAYNHAFARLQRIQTRCLLACQELRLYREYMLLSLSLQESAGGLRARRLQPLATEAEQRVIFSNIEQVAEMHLRLSQVLAKLAGMWPAMNCVGGALAAAMWSFESYDQYAEGLGAARKTLMFVEKSREATRRWLLAMQERSSNDGQALMALLSRPVEFVMEAITALRSLLLTLTTPLLAEGAAGFDWRRAESYHAGRVLAQFERVARVLRRHDEREQRAALLMTEKTIVGAKEADFIVRDRRRLVRKGPLTIATEKRFMFLFSDGLCLVTKPESHSNDFAFKYVVELAGAELVREPQKAASNAFELRTVNRPFHVVCRSVEERVAWLEALDDVLARLRHGVFGKSLPAQGLPPLIERMLARLRALDVSNALWLQSPSDTLLHPVRRRIEAQPDAVAELDAPAVSALLRAYLLELPEPLVPLPDVPMFSATAQPDLARVPTLIGALPQSAVALLGALLSWIAGIRLMPASYLPPAPRWAAQVLAPALCWRADERASTASAHHDQAELLLTVLIENADAFPFTARSAVKWRTEMLALSFPLPTPLPLGAISPRRASAPADHVVKRKPLPIAPKAERTGSTIASPQRTRPISPVCLPQPQSQPQPQTQPQPQQQPQQPQQSQPQPQQQPASLPPSHPPPLPPSYAPPQPPPTVAVIPPQEAKPAPRPLPKPAAPTAAPSAVAARPAVGSLSPTRGGRQATSPGRPQPVSVGVAAAAAAAVAKLQKPAEKRPLPEPRP